jgi:hypothetical protein
MRRGAALCGLLAIGLLSCELELEPEEEEDEIGSLSQEATRPGYWTCSRGPWYASTSYRAMQAPTRFECGIGCPDASHTQPNTWVDIVGGISQSCEDHSDSFFGPYSGEWNGCSIAYPAPNWQISTYSKPIAGVNQNWDRWPTTWRNGRYDQCSLSSLVTTAYMQNAFATVYDLDYCSQKQLIGTIPWGNVPVTARVQYGSTSPTSCTSTGGTGSVQLTLEGGRGSACSGVENSCANVVCANLSVRGSLSCTWSPPQTCNDAGAYCNAYNNTNDSSCCSYYCYNFRCR